jgi:tetraacyldisaccharide 4'-kinase
MPFFPDATAFRRLVDGSLQGLAPALGRICLGGLELPYTAIVAARNLAYDWQLVPLEQVTAPVISIGNITLGGTGKTPLVAWLARKLVGLGYRPAIVSRGYGAARGEVSDEAAELAILLPGVLHRAARRRSRAAREAIAAEADVILLDDGFQHRRLARGLDLVAIDATDPFGCGRVFPRGLLREPLRGIARARGIILTRSDQVSAEQRTAIRAALTNGLGHRMPQVWAEARHRPVGWRTPAGEQLPLDALRSGSVVAFAGIGNPDAFVDSLRRVTDQIKAVRRFPDHHRYTAAECEGLASWARTTAADWAVTTLKDLVKIPGGSLGGIPLVALEISLELTCGEDAILDLVRHALASPK